MSIIGVIGGVGPNAGLDLVGKIFNNTRATKDQDHLNCMLISCPSIIPNRLDFLLRSGKESRNPAFGLFESARRLYMAGVRYAVVACNTAHANEIFSPFLAMAKKSLPDLLIINMLETCADYVKESLPEIKRLGLLATKGTHSCRIYHEYFREEDGLYLIEPDEDGQERMHEAIFSEAFGIKAHSKEIKNQARELIHNEINLLIDRGAEAVILGCTELPLAVQQENFKIPFIDPGLVAARRLILLTAPEKLLV